uniref:Uncharacterized protein n=1 Tax=Caenorhabditis japonica TaxID=281687 RepID=A0A8R1IIP7_CAEJA
NDKVRSAVSRTQSKNGAAPKQNSPKENWYERELRPKQNQPERELVQKRTAQSRTARLRTGTNVNWYNRELLEAEPPEFELVRKRTTTNENHPNMNCYVTELLQIRTSLFRTATVSYYFPPEKMRVLPFDFFTTTLDTFG